jgi:hypothetical protein|tara:strand:- start:123 stop:485 length:363 start_codon:yes stop_codon:yes gene_type:complete
MITPYKFGKILSKLPKQEIHKVELSLMDDIEDELSRGFGMEDLVLEQLDIAQEAMTKARDIRKFEMLDASGTAGDMIAEAEEALKKLGVDKSPELERYKQQEQDLDNLIKELEQKQDMVG